MTDDARLLSVQGTSLSRAMIRIDALTELLTEALAVLMYESANTFEVVEALELKTLALLGLPDDIDWREHLTSLR